MASINNSSNKLTNNSDFFDELKIGIEKLSEIISENKKKENLEIEVRIGQIQHDGFNPGLNSKEFYDKIKTTLDTCKIWKKVINNKTEELCSNGIRRTLTYNGKKVMKHQCIRKEKILTTDLSYSGTPYDLRISASKEIPVEDKIKTGTGILRKKNRFSYYHEDYRIDLTIVEQIENGVSCINYELEVELLNIKNEISDKYRAHSCILLMRDMINMCEKIEKGSKLELLVKKEKEKDDDEMIDE